MRAGICRGATGAGAAPMMRREAHRRHRFARMPIASDNPSSESRTGLDVLSGVAPFGACVISMASPVAASSKTDSGRLRWYRPISFRSVFKGPNRIRGQGPYCPILSRANGLGSKCGSKKDARQPAAPTAFRAQVQRKDEARSGILARRPVFFSSATRPSISPPRQPGGREPSPVPTVKSGARLCCVSTDTQQQKGAR
jgi:hypothetical protein